MKQAQAEPWQHYSLGHFLIERHLRLLVLPLFVQMLQMTIYHALLIQTLVQWYRDISISHPFLAMPNVTIPAFPNDVPAHPLLIVDYDLIKASDEDEIDKLWKAATELGFW